MSLAEDLLIQARHIAELDPRRPKQANLRRASSSAYYAVFHLLVAAAVKNMIPDRPSSLRDRVSRSFQHNEMKESCSLFRANPTPARLINILGVPVSVSLRSVARSFVELQELRHIADYDVADKPTRSQALQAVADAEQVFALWKSIRATDEANVFLAALIFSRRSER